MLALLIISCVTLDKSLPHPETVFLPGNRYEHTLSLQGFHEHQSW